MFQYVFDVSYHLGCHLAFFVCDLLEKNRVVVVEEAVEVAVAVAAVGC